MKHDDAAIGGRIKVLDSLRAFSIVSVVLYHAYPSWFPGGYVGVDAFFLISGFIIWTKYAARLADRSVSYRQFFARRVRRLVPAYVFNIGATTIAAYLILSPGLLFEFGWSLAGQGLYLQNLVFLVQGEYFVNALKNPLIHTWSLAIEEQFYLLFALVIITIGLKPRLRLVLFLLATILSFAAAFALVEVSSRGVFYLLPFRIWEFALGFLMAHAASAFANRLERSQLVTSGLTAIALGLLAIAVLWPGAGARAPLLQALVALTGGSVLLLIGDALHGRFGAVLKAPMLQHLGRISYSWYLWHWPMISLCAISLGRPPSGWLMAALIVAGYVCGVASYYLVEIPTQRSGVLKKPLNALLAVLAMLIGCALVGWWFIASGGVVSRFPAAKRPYISAHFDNVGERCPILQRIRLLGQAVCQRNAHSGKPGVLIVGDSFSNMIRPIVTELANEHEVPLYVSTEICRPTEIGRSLCPPGYWDELLAGARNHRIGKVLLAVSWPGNFDLADYRYSIERLRSLGVDVYVMLAPPSGEEFDPQNYTFGRRELKDLSHEITWTDFERSDYLRERGPERRALQQIAHGDAKVHLLDPSRLLCPDRCVFALAGKPIFVDDKHLNREGARAVKPVFAPIFAESAPGPGAGRDR